MAKIFSVVNQKGGVGKTTTAINLASALAAVKKRILLVDFDPQANASTGLSGEKTRDVPTSYELLHDPSLISKACLPTIVPNLFLLRASQDLSAAEIELASLQSREQKLKEVLFHVEHLYDYIFIDCPPSLGLLTLNALSASNEIIIPIQCEFFALEGLKHLLITIQKTQKHLNPQLKIQGVLLTMKDQRNLLNRQVASDVRSYLKNTVYQTIIPRSIKIPESSSFGKPVIIYELMSLGSKAYLDLAKEFLERESKCQSHIQEKY